MAFSHAVIDQAYSKGLQGYSVPPYHILPHERTIFHSFIYYEVGELRAGIFTVMRISVWALRVTLLLEQLS